MELVRSLPESLLGQALTHPHAVGDRSASYERLEFLGDSVLGLAVAARLYERLPVAPEGRLAKLKAYAVSRRSCAAVGRAIGLPEFIREVAPVDEEHRREMAENQTILGNVLEALIGSCFLAFGFERVAPLVAEAFEPRIEHALRHTVDYKSALQEALAAKGSSAAYSVVRQEGPPHARSFTSIVLVDGRVCGQGTGRSIKRSEQSAALEALVRLGLLREESGEWHS